MFLNGLNIDLDQRFEHKRRIPASEAMILQESLINEEKGDLLSALLLNFITVVAYFPKRDVSLGLEDVVSPLHKFSPNGGGSLGFELPLPGQQLFEIILSYHKSNISCMIMIKRVIGLLMR